MNKKQEIFIPHINIENDNKQSDERCQINMIYDKEYDERAKIDENKE